MNVYDTYGSIAFVIHFYTKICCRSSDRTSKTLTRKDVIDQMLADILQPGVSTAGSSAGDGLQLDFLQPVVSAIGPLPAEAVVRNVEQIANVPVDATEENVQHQSSAASRYLFIFFVPKYLFSS